MSDPKERRPEDLSVDELIQSTKEAIEEKQPEFHPTLPAEYADLVNDEELEEEYYDDEDDRFRIPGIIKGLLYVCCVLAVSILLAVFAWKAADDVLSLTTEDRVETVTVTENTTMSQLANTLEEKGLVKYPWLFNLYCMFSNAQEKIDPGTYELNAVFDYHALVYGMIETSENRATVEVTIPEGYEAEDIF